MVHIRLNQLNQHHIISSLTYILGIFTGNSELPIKKKKFGNFTNVSSTSSAVKLVSGMQAQSTATSATYLNLCKNYVIYLDSVYN